MPTGAFRGGGGRLRGEHVHGHRSGRRREPPARPPGAAPQPGGARRHDRLLRADQPGTGGELVRGGLRHWHWPPARRPARDSGRDLRRRGTRVRRQPAPRREREHVRGGRLCGSDARFPQGPGGMRSVLHVLHRPLRARAQPQRRAAPRLGRAAPARRARVPRGRSHRHSSRRLRSRSAARDGARRSGGDDRRGGARAAPSSELDRPAGGHPAAARSDRSQRRPLPALAHARPVGGGPGSAAYAPAVRQRPGAGRVGGDPARFAGRGSGHRRDRRVSGRKRGGLRRRQGAAAGRAVHLLPRVSVLAPQGHDRGEGGRPRSRRGRRGARPPAAQTGGRQTMRLRPPLRRAVAAGAGRGGRATARAAGWSGTAATTYVCCSTGRSRW